MNGGVPRREWYEASLGARKQGGILLPTTDAKYSAAFEMSRKLLGLYEMLSEVDIAPAVQRSFDGK